MGGRKIATIAIGVSPKAGGGFTADVPVNALAEDGVPPEEGDQVSFSCEGKIQSVSGSSATVSIDSINGEPVGEEASESSQEEATEPETGTEGGAPTPGGRTPVAASGPSDRAGSMAPLGGGLAPARARLDRKGTNLMRQKLMKGARGQPLPF